MLHVIAATLSLLLLAGMFSDRAEPADRAGRSAEPAETDQDSSGNDSDR